MNLHNRKQAPDGDPAGGGSPAPAPPPFTYGDAHKDYVTAKGWKGVDDVILSNKNLETLLGADKAGRSVLWPKDENDAEGWKAIRSRLGVPEKAEDYQLPLMEGATELDAFQKALVVELHKNGIPKAAAQALAKFVNDFDTQTLQADTAAREKASADGLTALKTEWGTAHDANLGLAVTLMGHMGFTKDEIAALSKDADTLRRFHKGATALGTKPMAQGSGDGITQLQAREKLEAARQQRIEGKISEKDWLDTMARLSPIANAA